MFFLFEFAILRLAFDHTHLELRAALPILLFGEIFAVAGGKIQHLVA
jgi:hypothetical protein